MKLTIKQIFGYILYILLSNAIYGILLYFLITTLFTYSKLLAYLGNLLFIIVCLLLDVVTKKQLSKTKDLATKVETLEEKDKLQNHRYVRWVFKNFVSFKTSLFFFYIFILIFSQILNFEPTLVSPKIGDFIHLIDYSVIILLAFKDFGEEFTKDRTLMNEKLEEYDTYISK